MLKSNLSHRSAGFTSVELLVALTLTLIVFTATAGMLISGLHSQGLVENRTAQLDQAQLAVQRLVRNLREATSLTVSNASSITYSLPVPTGTESVTFSCSSTSGICTQTVGSSHVTEITGVSNTNIFTATPSTNPTYIGIMLSLSSPGETAVSLSDGANLRNITLGS